jgi:hypothetical protein
MQRTELLLHFSFFILLIFILFTSPDFSNILYELSNLENFDPVKQELVML